MFQAQWNVLRIYPPILWAMQLLNGPWEENLKRGKHVFFCAWVWVQYSQYEQELGSAWEWVQCGIGVYWYQAGASGTLVWSRVVNTPILYYGSRIQRKEKISLDVFSLLFLLCNCTTGSEHKIRYYRNKQVLKPTSVQLHDWVCYISCGHEMYKTVLSSVEGELFVCETHFINKPARERTGNNNNNTSHAPKSGLLQINLLVLYKSA